MENNRRLPINELVAAILAESHRRAPAKSFDGFQGAATGEASPRPEEDITHTWDPRTQQARPASPLEEMFELGMQYGQDAGEAAPDAEAAASRLAEGEGTFEDLMQDYVARGGEIGARKRAEANPDQVAQRKARERAHAAETDLEPGAEAGRELGGAQEPPQFNQIDMAERRRLRNAQIRGLIASGTDANKFKGGHWGAESPTLTYNHTPEEAAEIINESIKFARKQAFDAGRR